MLFIRSLPGFVVTGANAGELRERVSDSLRAHLEWLVERELIEQPSGDVDLAVVEDLSAKGKVGPRFLADLLPPTADEVEQALAVGRAALSDLIDAYDVLGDERAGDLVLHHIAAMDRAYAGKIGDSSTRHRPSRMLWTASTAAMSPSCFCATARSGPWRKRFAAAPRTFAST